MTGLVLSILLWLWCDLFPPQNLLFLINRKYNQHSSSHFLCMRPRISIIRCIVLFFFPRSSAWLLTLSVEFHSECVNCLVYFCLCVVSEIYWFQNKGGHRRDIFGEPCQLSLMKYCLMMRMTVTNRKWKDEISAGKTSAFVLNFKG